MSRIIRWFFVVVVLITACIPTGYFVNNVVKEWQYNLLINSAEYKAQYGKWDVIDLPDDLTINAIHTAMLPSGKVLLVAGSGNNRSNFEAGTFQTIVYDPVTSAVKFVNTPEDLFCGGHAFLPDGNLLIAGGTQSYEIQAPDVTVAGGYVTIRNENPIREFTLPKGTLFTGVDSGKTYRSDSEVTIPRADKNSDGYVTASERNVFVEATEPGDWGVWNETSQYAIDGYTGVDADGMHSFATKMSMDKKEYQGIRSTYEFDPYAEAYVRVGDMHYARWYPTTTTLPDGRVMVLSGLDGAGKILEGQNEIYDPATGQWTEVPDLKRYFPTYPSVFQTADPNRMFFSGPSTGWGNRDEGRDPGFWNLGDNSFSIVPGLRDPDMLETGGSMWLGAVNDQRLVVVGGGGVGDSDRSTDRIDIIDLSEPNPQFTPLGKLDKPTRYPTLVTQPTGSLFVTGGATDYRGRGDSNILESYNLNPDGTLDRMADPRVGRNYHSGGVLLPTGQILTTGSDPLFENRDNTLPGKFDKRIEIFTPPYLFQADDQPVVRPTITGGPEQGIIHRYQPATFTVGSSDTSAVVPKITNARLLLPGAFTHATDTNQRMIELTMTQDPMNGSVTVTLPENQTLTPPGFYMLFLVDDRGMPSVASWVQVQ